MFEIFSSKQKQEVLTDYCKTKYPVILVHGIGFRDNIPTVRYWSDVPDILTKNGCKVFLSNQDAISTHETNAKQIKHKIIDILDFTGAEKINIIAHSKGGLEARYMISKLNMDSKVASLTTISTPHKGSSLADFGFETFRKYNIIDFAGKASLMYAKLLGDINPMPTEAFKQLTTKYMEGFNEKVKDSPHVYYQSYGSLINENYPGLYSRFKYKIIYKYEGPNDGDVALTSFKWGNFVEVVGQKEGILISHHDIIGFTKNKLFDIEKFYTKLVNGLKKMGF